MGEGTISGMVMGKTNSKKGKVDQGKTFETIADVRAAVEGIGLAVEHHLSNQVDDETDHLDIHVAVVSGRRKGYVRWSIRVEVNAIDYLRDRIDEEYIEFLADKEGMTQAEAAKAYDHELSHELWEAAQAAEEDWSHWFGSHGCCSTAIRVSATLSGLKVQDWKGDMAFKPEKPGEVDVIQMHCWLGFSGWARVSNWKLQDKLS